MSFFVYIFFLFGNIGSVKNISEFKDGNAMWFSPVNCPRCCSSLSCDINNDKLRCMELFKYGDKRVRCAIVRVTTTYHSNMAQRLPGTTNFIFQR